MSVINTNVKALYTQAALKISGREGATAMQQLSTGKRINSAKDDAAGMAIADRMTQQIRSLNQAVRNAGDAISLIQTAEGATNEITDMLQRMRELSIQAINDTNSGDQRAYLDLEFQQLKQEIVRISDTTEWNGFPLLNGTGGVPQGEQPVYKVQSTPAVATEANFTGVPAAIAEPIEQQLLTFTDADPQIQRITFADVGAAEDDGGTIIVITASEAVDDEGNNLNEVTVEVADIADDATAEEVAAAVVRALNEDADFQSAGRLAIDNEDGTVDIVFARADGAAPDVDFTGSDVVDVSDEDISSAEPLSGGGEITVGGVTVAIDAGDSAATVAEKVKAALVADSSFATSTGRIIKDNIDGTLTVTYTEADADVQDLVFVDSDAVGTTMSSATQTVRDAEVSFGNSGRFLKAGELSLAVRPLAEIHTIVFGPATAAEDIVVGDVTVTTVNAGDTAAQVAFKVKTALELDDAFNSDSGRTIVNNYDGSLTITYAIADGDIPENISFSDPDESGVTASVFTTRNYGQVTATYDVDDGDNVTLVGTVDPTAGTVNFAKDSVAQVDTFTLSGNAEDPSVIPADTALTFTVNDLTFTYTLEDDTEASTVAETLVAEINANRSLSQLVTAELQRDGTFTLTSKVAGDPMTAYAVVTRAEGDETTAISSATTVANVTAGNNSLVVSEDMVVTMYDDDGLADDITLRGTETTLNIARAYPDLPILRAGDLIINGITIGPSFAEDDTFSSSNNAGGALAKAAAINREKHLTGVQAVVSEAVLTGTAMSRGDAVTGTLTINGYTSPVITTTLNNTRESRATVVEAINRMTARTGVVATDSGTDEQGVRLTAADGRNIEVFFNTASDNAVFASQTGLREGLTTGSIALESKVEAPVLLTSSGNINNIGFVAGDYSVNHTVVANSDRSIALPPQPQISAVTWDRSILEGDSVSVTINGQTKTVEALADDGVKHVLDSLIDAVNNDSAMAAAVTAVRGANPSQIYFVSNVPGTEFTVSASTSATDGYIDVEEVQSNSRATNVKLNTGDLVINGIAIPGSRADTDIRSPNGIASGQRDSSGIAIAAAINSVADRTGVSAEVKPASMEGTSTVTGAPGVFPETGMQSLYINGIEVEIALVEDEPADTRREKVVAAINRKLDSHGVEASNNGRGVTLTSSDGRNVSVWFDSAVPGLSPSSFGLSTGDEVAQVSKVNVTSDSTTATTVTIEINGVSITTDEIDADSGENALANALKSAIETALNNGSLTNMSLSVFNGEVTITSTIPGSGFTIRGADSSSGEVQMEISTTTENSLGGSPVTGIWNGNASSDGALTMYSGVELISELEFTVSAGTNGYSDPVHWHNLGFTEGTFGGRSSIDMSPPRVGRMTFQVGATMNQSIYIDFADFGKNGIITGDITGDVDLWNSESRVNRIDNRESAQAVLTKLDTVLDKVNGTRATMGAVMNRLEHVIDNLMNVSMNSEASRSQIEDADYAAASTELARTQIMQQAATSVLAQANADQQNVLKLLQ